MGRDGMGRDGPCEWDRTGHRGMLVSVLRGVESFSYRRCAHRQTRMGEADVKSIAPSSQPGPTPKPQPTFPSTSTSEME